jgi:hypothetical protein
MEETEMKNFARNVMALVALVVIGTTIVNAETAMSEGFSIVNGSVVDHSLKTTQVIEPGALLFRVQVEATDSGGNSE